MATVNAKIQVGINSEIYRDCPDTSIKIKKVLKTEKETIAGYTAIISTVIFEDITLNNGNKFKFKNNNEGIKVMLEDMNTETDCPELFNHLIDYTKIPKDKYTLNQIVRAINVTTSGTCRDVMSIYCKSINVPRKQDTTSPNYDMFALTGNIIVYENYLLNLVYVQEINLKTLKSSVVRLPFASDTNISYIQLSHSEYHRVKYFLLGEAPRLHSTNKLFITSIEDFEKSKECYLVNLIDGNKLNCSLKNLELVKYGDCTRSTNKNLTYRYYLYNTKKGENSDEFNNLKEMADYIYAKKLFGENTFIYDICNALAKSVLLGVDVRGYKAVKFCNDTVGKNIIKKRKAKYIYYAQILATGEIIEFNDDGKEKAEQKFTQFIADFKHIKYTSASKYFRGYFNTGELDEIDPRT